MHPNSKKGNTPGLDFLPADQALVFQTPQGMTRIWTPAPTMLVTQVVGSLTGEAAVAMSNELRRVVASDGRHIGFHDWEEMTNYETASRVELTSQVREVLAVTDAVHFLVSSKVVAFGIQAANIILKLIQVHATRASFESTLRDTIRRRAHSVAERPPSRT